MRTYSEERQRDESKQTESHSERLTAKTTRAERVRAAAEVRCGRLAHQCQGIVLACAHADRQIGHSVTPLIRIFEDYWP